MTARFGNANLTLCASCSHVTTKYVAEGTMRLKRSRRPMMRFLFASQSQLDLIEDYVKSVAELLKDRLDRFKASLEKKFDGQPEPGDHDLEAICGEYLTIRDAHPNLLYSGAFLAIYGAVEQQTIAMHRFALHCRQQPSDDTRQILSIKDVVRNQRLENANSAWPEMKQLFEVRNQIAHDIGDRVLRDRINDNDKPKDRSEKVDAYVRDREKTRKPGLHFDRDSLILTADFCQETIEVSRCFLSELLCELEKTIPEEIPTETCGPSEQFPA